MSRSIVRLTIRTALLAGALALTALAGCEREDRRFREPTPAATAGTLVSMSEIQPGVATDQRDMDPDAEGPYDENAWAIAEGQRFYNNFNCVGCHAQGGGGSGPPLMDDEWIYGSEPENIFATIIEGRPNGMPSFRGRIGNQQVWQIVAYVRSMSGLTPMDARTSRYDHMQIKKAENLKRTERPRSSSSGAETPEP